MEPLRASCEQTPLSRPPSEGTTLTLQDQGYGEVLAEIRNRLISIESLLSPAPGANAHLTAREAADYLRISYSTFRKKATKIRRQPGTGRYRVEDLDDFAASLRPRRKR